MGSGHTVRRVDIIDYEISRLLRARGELPTRGGVVYEPVEDRDRGLLAEIASALILRFGMAAFELRANGAVLIAMHVEGKNVEHVIDRHILRGDFSVDHLVSWFEREFERLKTRPAG